WGYTPDQVAHLEPTCLGLLALSLEAARFPEAIAKGRQILRRSALPDGSYRLERGREEAVWPTALALFVQSALGRPAEDFAPPAGPVARPQRQPAGQHRPGRPARHRPQADRLALGREQLLLGRADRVGLPGAAPRRPGEPRPRRGGAAPAARPRL